MKFLNFNLNRARAPFRAPRTAHRQLILLLAMVCAVLVVTMVAGAIDLTRGDSAPVVDLTTIDGRTITVGGKQDAVQLLVFGKAGDPKTNEACDEIISALGTTGLADQPMQWVLILSKSSDVIDIPARILNAQHTPMVVHDIERKAFGAYGIVVLPSVAIMNRDGQVAHTMAAMTHRFHDTIVDALNLALGRLSAEQFDKRLHPDGDTHVDATQLRARRIALMARRLADRGLFELSQRKYAEALKIDPDCSAAHLGLGDLFLNQDKLDEAEAHFQSVIKRTPQSIPATLGMAHVHAARGGEVHLKTAARLVQSVLERDVSNPRGYFIFGLIDEQRGAFRDAATHYRKAAELLFKQQPSGERPETGAATPSEHANQR